MHGKALILAAASAVLVIAGIVSVGAQPQKADKSSAPNILVIMGDDIGYWNLSTYNQGMMGFRTPNIDSIANDGMKFTDAYAENSCTAGRSAFITGQSPFRTGLLKVGLPGAKEGLSGKDPTLAELLKPRGYTSGQFGKNHLGDRNEFLPTVHGFDEFFGNLYHLNAEEEPEQEFYPKDPAFRQRFGPRGVFHCYSTNSLDSTVDPRFGVMGKQKCEDTGPLTRKRMETVDEEFLKAGIDFMERAKKAGKPFFIWFNSTRMHIYTHLKPERKARPVSGFMLTEWSSTMARWASYSRNSKPLGSRIIRSSFIPLITVLRSCFGPTAG
jgi:arylsulfatase